MIICQVCGTRNADGERFCGQCGTFLEWEGTVIDRATGQEIPAPAPAANTATEGAVAPPPPPPAPTETAVATVPPPPPSPAPTATTAETAGAAPERMPPERLPGQAARRRVVEDVPDAPSGPKPGDLICPTCGTGNDAVRRFCRSCGASLATAVPVKLRWWQRLWRWLTRRTEYAAGERRRRRTALVGRLIRIIALLLVVTLGVVFGPGLVRRGINEVRDRTRKPEPISATAFAASSARGDNPAARIGDGKNNRYWAPTGKAQGSWVEATFAKPYRILDIIVTPGVGIQKDQFVTVARPHELDVLATPDKGEPKRFTLTLTDAPGPQSFKITSDRTVKLRLTVRSTFGPTSIPPVAIAEVEFYGRT